MNSFVFHDESHDIRSRPPGFTVNTLLQGQGTVVRPVGETILKTVQLSKYLYRGIATTGKKGLIRFPGNASTDELPDRFELT